MPAGTDLVTWSPRVGATGDDRYDVPDNTIVKAGSSAYSAIPLLSETNLGSDLNQIISEINARIYLLYGAFILTDGNYGLKNYASVNSKIDTLPSFSSCKSYINDIITLENKTAFSWTIFPPSEKMLKKHISEPRKALSNDLFRVNLSNASAGPIKLDQAILRRQNNFYPPTTTTRFTASTIAGTVQSIGQSFSGVTYTKLRYFLSFKVPSILPTINAATLRIYVNIIGTNAVAQSGLLNVYQTSSLLNPIATGDWDKLLVINGGAPLATNVSLSLGYNDIPLSGWTLVPGGSYTIILATTKDVADTTPASASNALYTISSGYQFTTDFNWHITMWDTNNPCLLLYT